MTDQATPQINIEDLTAKYVKLRDKKDEMKKRHKEELKPLNAIFEKLDAVIMQHLDSINADNIKSKAGTVSILDKSSATVTDPEAFRAYVKDMGDWDVCDLRANAPAVLEYIKANGTLPPGVKYNTFRTLGVRRASSTPE